MVKIKIVLLALIFSGCQSTDPKVKKPKEVVVNKNYESDELTDEEIIQRLELQLQIEDFIRDLEKTKTYRLETDEEYKKRIGK